jgi:hypothetical protein
MPDGDDPPAVEELPAEARHEPVAPIRPNGPKSDRRMAE